MVGAGGADVGGGGRRRDTQNLDYVLRSMLAGGLAGSAAKTAIGRESGVRGLFQGNSATLMRIFPYAAIKFMAYEQFKTVTSAGAPSRLTTVLVTYPLELIRVRLAFDTTHAKSPGVIGTMREIWNERRLPAAHSAPGTPSPAKPTAAQQTAGAGAAAHFAEPALTGTAGRFAGSPALPTERGSFIQRLPESIPRHFPLVNFYRGFLPTVLGILPYAGSSFVIYSHLTKLCASWLGLASEKELRGWWTLASGGAAGAAAQTVAYPAEVAYRLYPELLRIYPLPGRLVYFRLHDYIALFTPRPPTWDLPRRFLARWTRIGSFEYPTRAEHIGYLKVAPMSAIAFLVYEEMKVILSIF
ncbi:MAG: hypothetical protein BJ554DRAFT_2376 [Olpidium bornovanus]|uniref:Mitochondrial carrier protein n=1 Tax=Olpidium bornovanus TaxID=278681 RepID=A0A8H8DGP7_9FUNG|nr:MAG: hypothetical protein BJ554DRAFT_2376 [Olpidium bornovanus]